MFVASFHMFETWSLYTGPKFEYNSIQFQFYLSSFWLNWIDEILFKNVKHNIWTSLQTKAATKKNRRDNNVKARVFGVSMNDFT